MPMFIRSLLVLAFASLACAQTPTTPLESQIHDKISSFQGKVSLFAKNLETGETYSVAGDVPTRTASTIKLAIMTECFAEVNEGKLSFSEPLTLRHDEKTSGSGVLTEFSDNVQLPLADVMHLMIVVSDNTATNLLLSRIGGNAVNARMQALGLTNTRVMRKILRDGGGPAGITEEGAKPENKKWGLGRTSPQEMVTLLDRIYHGQLISKSASDEMLAVLKRQHYHDGIGRDLNGVTIASKSGALDHFRSDVGIVYSDRGPIAMAVTVDDMPEAVWTDDNPGDLLIARLSELLIEKLGTSPKKPTN
jgi:beta-lactamase class A